MSYKTISKIANMEKYGMEDIIFVNQVRALMIFGFLILFFIILRFLQFSGGTTLTVRSVDLAVVVR